MNARLVAARFIPGCERDFPRDGICCVELQDRASEIALADVFRVAGAIYGADKLGFLSLPGGARVPIAEAVVPSPRLEIYCRLYAHPGCWDAYEDDD